MGGTSNKTLKRNQHSGSSAFQRHSAEAPYGSTSNQAPKHKRHSDSTTLQRHPATAPTTELQSTNNSDGRTLQRHPAAAQAPKLHATLLLLEPKTLKASRHPFKKPEQIIRIEKSAHATLTHSTLTAPAAPPTPYPKHTHTHHLTAAPCNGTLQRHLAMAPACQSIHTTLTAP